MDVLKTFYKEPHVDVVYGIVKSETRGLDSVYEDYILTLVGSRGLNVLLINDLVVICGLVDERRLFTLVDRK